jgi:hypothetical protein
MALIGTHGVLFRKRLVPRANQGRRGIWPALSLTVVNHAPVPSATMWVDWASAVTVMGRPLAES